MKKRTKLTQEIKDEVCRLRVQRYKLQEIAEMAGICKSSVQSILNEAEISKKWPSRLLSPEELKRNSHLTRLKLAIRYGVSYTVMCQYLKKYGIEVAPSRPGRKPLKKPKIEEPKPVIPIKRHQPEYNRINKGLGIAAELHNW